MRTVEIRGLATRASVIGFGCASLGSRIGGRQGLRALEEAHACGVNWFDLAPAYGAGDAETLFGRFARGRRSRLLVCSKVGLAPPRRNAMLKLCYSLARPLLGTAKGLRRRFRRVPATRNVHVALTPDRILASLDASLARIGTDYLDLFALHKPAAEDVGRDDVLEVLSAILRSGRASQVGVSGDLAAGFAAARHPDVYGIVQIADDPWSNPVAELQSAAPVLTVVSHSVLGLEGSLDRLVAQVAAAGAPGRKLMNHAGYSGDLETAVSRLLVDRALAVNRNGVVLLSMFGAAHRAANIQAASEPVKENAVMLVDQILRLSATGMPER